MSISDIVLPLHLITLAITFVFILLADHQGFAWMCGKILILDKKKIKQYHDIVFLGLLVMVFTGGVLAWPAKEFLFKETLFVVKMLFVLGLFVNSFVIGKLMDIATTRTYISLMTKEKIPLFISGAVSTICWLGATIVAFVFFG